MADRQKISLAPDSPPVDAELIEVERATEQWNLESALRQLDEVGTLEQDWDSYGSEPANAETIAAARKLIIDAYRRSKFAPYFVAPVSGGGIQIEWRGSHREIEVELGPDGESLSYLLIEAKGTPNRKSIERHNVDAAQILTAIDRVNS